MVALVAALLVAVSAAEWRENMGFWSCTTGCHCDLLNRCFCASVTPASDIEEGVFTNMWGAGHTLPAACRPIDDVESSLAIVDSSARIE